MNLLKQYNLKQSQYDYEVERAKKKNLTIEDWLKYRFAKKNSQLLVDKNNNYAGRSLVVDILDNFGQETGFLLDKSLQKKFGHWCKKHKTFIKLTTAKNDILGKEIKYDWYYLQDLAFKEFDILLKLETNIKNIELFWILFGFISYYFRILIHKENEIKKMLKRFDRLDGSLIYRSQWGNFMRVIADIIHVNRENYDTFERENNSLIEEIIDINKKYSDLDYITIYRGFQLLVGDKNIRDELNKKKQKVGKGFYYTTNEDFGKLYSISQNIFGFFNHFIYSTTDSELEYLHQLNDSYFYDIHKLKIDRDKFSSDKNYRNKICNTKIFKNFFKKHIEKFKSSHDKNYPMKYDVKNRSMIGKYKVRKKDVIFYSNIEKFLMGATFREQSIFCFDENVDLLRYEFINQKDFRRVCSTHYKLIEK